MYRTVRRGGMPAVGAVLVCVLGACGTTLQVGDRPAATSEAGQLSAAGSGPAVTAPSDPTGPAARPLRPTSGGAPAGNTGRRVPPTATASTAAGASAGPPRDAGRPPSDPAAIPATGPGWDKDDVYLGIPTENDAPGTLPGVGIDFSPGNLNDDVAALLAAFNKAGGVLGRKIVAVFHNTSTLSIEANATSAAQSDCEYFSQDHRVSEAINFLPAVPLPVCLKPTGIPDIEAGSPLIGAAEYQQWGPYLYTLAEPNVDVIAHTMVQRLSADGFFDKWNAHTGSTSGGTTVKVGILEPDTPAGSELAERLASDVRSAGYDVAKAFSYKDSLDGYTTEMGSAVLQFAAAGVTHVLNIPPIALEELFFYDAASQQHYFPRSGVTSFSLPNQQVADLPHKELVGEVGISWTPTDASPVPAPSAQARQCDAYAKAAGIRDTTGLQVENFRGVCDAIRLFVAAAQAGGGFTAADLAAGMAKVGARFAPASTYSSELSASNHGLPGEVRDFRFDSSCTCMKYFGGLHPID
ncbi:MAG TPA: hypothetical protein VG708_13940 [Mycobacteriales bacterium]|nr:hypothetical protein [Mycobacteriales bacterium]